MPSMNLRTLLQRANELAEVSLQVENAFQWKNDPLKFQKVKSDDTNENRANLETNWTLKGWVGFSDLKYLDKGEKDVQITDISIDSRTLSDNCLFVALRGVRHDGHSFVPQILKQQIAIVIDLDYYDVHHEILDCFEYPPIILVHDTRKFLPYLVAAFFGNPSNELHITGVTGTNGKTTTCHIIESLLLEGAAHHSDANNDEGKVHNQVCDSGDVQVGILGTIEHRWPGFSTTSVNTTPESLTLQSYFRQMIDAGVSHVVMEASSHGLSGTRLEEVAFDVAIFTNLTQDHLDYHGSMEAYAEAKRRFFTDFIDHAQRNGKSPVAVINIDDPIGKEFALSARKHGGFVLTYAIDQEADLVATDIIYSPQGTEFTLQWNHQFEKLCEKFSHIRLRDSDKSPLPQRGISNEKLEETLTKDGDLPTSCIEPQGESSEPTSEEGIQSLECTQKKERVSTTLIGKFNLYNILAGVVAAVSAGIPFLSVLHSISRIPQVPGRLQRVGKQCFVDYAHAPDAIASILHALRPLVRDGGKLKIVFGAGGDRDHSKRGVMGEIAAALADEIYVTSDNPRSEDPHNIIRSILEGINKHADKVLSELEEKLKKDPNTKITKKFKISAHVNRKHAIEMAFVTLKENDVLVVAGKGHETYQEIDGVKHPFSDVSVLEECMQVSWPVEHHRMNIFDDIEYGADGENGADGEEQVSPRQHKVKSSPPSFSEKTSLSQIQLNQTILSQWEPSLLEKACGGEWLNVQCDGHGGHGGADQMVSSPVACTRFTGVSVDTRTLEPGNIFVALHGDSFDGHDFVKQAHDKEASIAIVSHSIDTDLAQLVVKDPLRALQNLGHMIWLTATKSYNLRTITLTGSNGKTTTKELIYQLLKKLGNAYKTPGNFNNHIGVPLTLSRLTPAIDYAVIELGANDFGEIESLSKLVPSDVRMVVSIGDAHLERFGNTEGVYRAKSEIFSHATPSTRAILHERDYVRLIPENYPGPISVASKCDLSAFFDEETGSFLNRSECVKQVRQLVLELRDTLSREHHDYVQSKQGLEGEGDATKCSKNDRDEGQVEGQVRGKKQNIDSVLFFEKVREGEMPAHREAIDEAKKVRNCDESHHTSRIRWLFYDVISDMLIADSSTLPPAGPKTDDNFALAMTYIFHELKFSGKKWRPELTSLEPELFEQLPSGRSELLRFRSDKRSGSAKYAPIPTLTVVNDAYNANPTSLLVSAKYFGEKALQESESFLQKTNSKKFDEYRKIALIGQMNELGHSAKEMHERVARELVSMNLFDEFYWIGDFADVMYHAVESMQLFEADEKPRHCVLSSLTEIQSKVPSVGFLYLKASRTQMLEKTIALLRDDGWIDV